LRSLSNVGLIHLQVGHALRLGPEDALQVVGRHLVLVGRHVLGSEGVVLAAHVFGQAVEHLVGHVLRALEHQVLEEMREARAAGRIVLAADPVPDLHRHRAQARHRQADHAQAVGQAAVGQGQRRQRHRRRRPGRRGGPGQRGGRGEEMAPADHGFRYFARKDSIAV
jgi:hypothetical protein